MYKSFVLAIILCLSSSNADVVNYKTCASPIGTVKSVSVSGCDTSMPRCILKRNTNATIEIEFEASKAATDAKAIVHGVVLDVPTPFPLPNPDVCTSGVQCPIEASKTYKYSDVLPIYKKYPRVTVEIKWEIRANDEDFVCIIIPAKLQ